MAERIFISQFENFKGIDYRDSPLSADPNTFDSLLNLEFAETRSLRTRLGHQRVGQVGGFLKTHCYTYWDAVTGSTQQELLAINDCLWKLKTATLSITNGTNLNYTCAPESGNIHIKVYDGVTLKLDFNAGTGYESENAGALKTMEDFRAAVDATSLTCGLPSGIEFARINGTQSGVSTIVVDAGHSFAIGDWMTFWDFTSGYQKIVGRKVFNIPAANQLSFNSYIYSNVDVKDNQIIGPMATPAATVPFRNATATSGATLNIPFQYWDVVPWTTDYFYHAHATPFRACWFSRGSEGFTPPTFVNDRGICYIHSGYNDLTPADPHRAFSAYPFKYDGQRVYREGLPIANCSIGAVAGAGIGAGTYRYKVSFEQVDKRGSINVGRLSSEQTVTIAAAQNVQIYITQPEVDFVTKGTFLANVAVSNPLITIGEAKDIVIGDTIGFYDRTAPARWVYRKVTQVIADGANDKFHLDGISVTTNAGDTWYRANRIGWNRASARSSAAATNANTVAVYNTAALQNLIEIGDDIFFYDNLRADYVTRTVSAITATSITWAGEPASIAIDTDISANLKINIWRTRANSNVFYLVETIPCQYWPVAANPEYCGFYEDKVTDTVLGAQITYIDDPISGKEQDLPLRTRFACIHQGTRCASGGDDDPNTVFVYDSINSESVPAAGNSFDIPSNILGPITALASDTEDSLVAFKENAIYDVAGAVEEGAISVRTVAEGDYGISSHSSLAKIKGVIIGVGRLGHIGYKGGELLTSLGEPVAPAIWGNSSITLNRATGINDYTTRKYISNVFSSTNMGNGQVYDKYYLLDYGNDSVWFDWSFNARQDMNGGMAIYNDDFYCLSLSSSGSEFGCLHKRIPLNTNISSDMSLLYYDQHNLISNDMTGVFLTLNEPDLDKEWLWFKIYSIINPYDTARYASFTVTIEQAKDFVGTVIGSKDVAFTSAIFEQKMKLLSTKVRAMRFRVRTPTGAVVPNPMFITGLSYAVVGSYEKSDLK